MQRFKCFCLFLMHIIACRVTRQKATDLHGIRGYSVRVQSCRFSIYCTLWNKKKVYFKRKHGNALVALFCWRTNISASCQFWWTATKLAHAVRQFIPTACWQKKLPFLQQIAVRKPCVQPTWFSCCMKFMFNKKKDVMASNVLQLPCCCNWKNQREGTRKSCIITPLSVCAHITIIQPVLVDCFLQLNKMYLSSKINFKNN